MACWATLKRRRFRGSSSSSTEANRSRGRQKGAKEEKEEKDEKERKEDKKDARVDKVVMDAEIQIFVKADGEKRVPMEVSSKVKVRDVARRVLRTGESEQDVYVMSDGRMLKASDELRSCGVRAGSTVQVVRKLRGGGRSKGKMLSGGKKKSPKKVQHEGEELAGGGRGVRDVRQMLPNRSGRIERGNDGSDGGNGRRADGENVEDDKKQLRGGGGRRPRDGDWRNQEVRAGAKAEKERPTRGNTDGRRALRNVEKRMVSRR